MTVEAKITGRKYKAYTRKDIDRIPELQALPHHKILGIKAVSAVLPFRVNRYVIEELIRWEDVPDDPIYQLTFPQPGMLERKDLSRMMELVWSNAPKLEVEAAARQIQVGLNPHPAGQMEFNVPRLGQEPLEGMQHKYRETVLFFPSQGQTCHAYCTYCFRWPQFVGIDELKFASNEAEKLVDYLKQHREVSSVLFTGGDPLIMKTAVLRRYLEPLLSSELQHLVSIRLGTKATAYWPLSFHHGPGCRRSAPALRGGRPGRQASCDHVALQPPQRIANPGGPDGRSPHPGYRSGHSLPGPSHPARQ